MAPNLNAFVAQPLTLGDLQTSGAITVAPIFGSPSPTRWLSLEQAIRDGAEARELPTPSVSEIVVANPTPHPLILVDGEEVLGAKQNRIVDGTYVVAAGSERVVQVCCVEQNRWDHSRREECFSSSTVVTSPTLRAVKSRTSRVTGRGDQSAVWGQVEHSIHETHTRTITRAMTDVFTQQAPAIDEMVGAFTLQPGQLGMVVGVGDRVWAVDFVGDVEAFATMYRRLLRGYAMDAFEVKGRAALSRAEMSLGLRRLMARPVSVARQSDRERTLRFAPSGLEPAADELPIEGTATVHDECLVAVSALLLGAPQGAIALEERQVRTSETHPIRVSWLKSPQGGLGLTFAPGKRASSQAGRRWHRDLELDLTRLREHERVDALVCLLSDDELAHLGVPDYVAQVASAGSPFIGCRSEMDTRPSPSTRCGDCWPT